ncbi:alkaline phosphatase D family protein [Aquimonas sp.]|jgi:alkaline phosphatase D|uniref:alkaline phosphatase D family protein n=1 Tax=Aquimonas sp. TaxID=1872588 RepID=UPI0037C1AA18
MTKVSRRQALAILGAGAGGLAAVYATGASSKEGASSQPAAKGDHFRHGVASGDPDASSLIIWTRITTDLPELDVTWRVAADPGFTELAASGTVRTGSANDWTVKPLVTGLQAGRVYFYQFTAQGDPSPIGRTRTLPAVGPDRLGIALASCSNFAFGHFNAYGAIAKDEDIDFVLHTGDYIYEYGGADSWGEKTGAAIGRRHLPAHETVTLQDYRTRHAQYKSDEGSQAMHAAHPLLCCWDDHESTNNPWKDGAQNHQADTEGSWQTRRAASVQAYYEWMPIREPEAGRTRLEFWRTYVFGDLATLVTLETRHTARGMQIDYETWKPKLEASQDYESFRRDVIGDPDRAMLSPGMEDALRSALSHSREINQPWRLIGNASPIARMLVPDLVGAGVLEAPGADALDAHTRLAWLGQHRLPFYTDTWDGYPAARERFYDLCKSVDVQDLIVLTGDSHSFWLNTLADAAGNPMGVELGTAGITSPGDFVESGFSHEQSSALDAAFADLLDEVVWTDNSHQGYVRLVLETGQARTDFVAVRTVLQPDLHTRILRTSALFPASVTVRLADAG